MKKAYLLTLTLLAFTSSACRKNETAPAVALDEYVKTTVQYKSLPGSLPNLLSLDIYSYPASAAPRPVVLYVHGGGWQIGDKTNKLDNKLALFNSLHYLFISVNYRLSPSPSQLTNPNRLRYPAHNEDVADAVKWVLANIATYGGDPTKVVIMGHSAGAHLVALTGTSQLFLPARGIPLATIQGVASIDTEGYDVTTQSDEEIYQNAFGVDKAIQQQASPLHNVAAPGKYPRFFVAKRGSASRVALADAFIAKLQAAGVKVSQVNGRQYDHEGINDAIGAANDTVITPALIDFLQQCFQ